MLSSSSCARPAGAFRESRTPPGGRASNGGWRALGRAAVDRLRASASASGGAPDNIREQAKRLSKLFYAAEDDPFLAGRSPGSGEAGPVPAKVLKNLPLWRVQWSVAPASTSILHVHVPHYTHMFDQLFSQPGPWYFGHLYLPGGSTTLGNDQYKLKYGSWAPLVGCLMEVNRAVRLMDGKLLVLATAVARIRVTRAVQETPYSIADVELYPDLEEEAAHQTAAKQAFAAATASAGPGACGDGEEQFQEALDHVATAAAVGASWVWHSYEVAASRMTNWHNLPREGANDQETYQLVQAVVEHGVPNVLPCPDGPVLGRWDLGSLAAQAGQAAVAGAVPAAASILALQQTEKDATATGIDEVRMAARETYRLVRCSWGVRGGNMVCQRGVRQEEYKMPLAGEEEGLPAGYPWGLNMDQDLLLLEQRIWQELDTTAALALRVKGSRLGLPLGLLQLRPPKPPRPPAAAAAQQEQQQQEAAAVVASSAEQQAGDSGSFTPYYTYKYQNAASEGLDVTADPKYPVHRRAQRLSWALLTIVIPDNAAQEARQAYLETWSTGERLRLALAQLSKHRKVLAALAAVRELSDRQSAERDDKSSPFYPSE